MIKILAPLVVSALVFGYTANAATTDRYRTQNGAECSASYDDNHKFEFGLEGDPTVDSSGLVALKPFARYTYTFGGDTKRNRLDCTVTQSLEQERMRLDNARLLVELEMLRNELKNQAQAQTTVTDKGITDDKW